MSWYESLLFVHISMAAIWVGGAVMIRFFALRILRLASRRGRWRSAATSSGSATG